MYYSSARYLHFACILHYAQIFWSVLYPHAVLYNFIYLYDVYYNIQSIARHSTPFHAISLHSTPLFHSFILPFPFSPSLFFSAYPSSSLVILLVLLVLRHFRLSSLLFHLLPPSSPFPMFPQFLPFHHVFTYNLQMLAEERGSPHRFNEILEEFPKDIHLDKFLFQDESLLWAQRLPLRYRFRSLGVMLCLICASFFILLGILPSFRPYLFPLCYEMFLRACYG